MAVAGRSYANVPVISRGALEDPTDLNSQTRVVVVAAAVDRRWFSAAPVTVTANPQTPPAAPSVSTPGPVVVTSQPPWPGTVQALTARNTLQDPPVLTTAGPVVVAAVPDRRWFNPSLVTVLRTPLTTVAAPQPVVVAGQPPWPKTAQAITVRSTLQDPPALTTPRPIVVAGASDQRWFAVRPARVVAGASPAATPPPAVSGLLMAGIV